MKRDAFVVLSGIAIWTALSIVLWPRLDWETFRLWTVASPAFIIAWVWIGLSAFNRLSP